jgi:ankyrin repeat protein
MIKEDIESNQTQTPLPFNIRDENRNTILHHLFSLFQDDGFKDQAQHLCQELISLASSGLITFNYNETNKQGMTPLDLAIELRLNHALSYALALNAQKASDPLFLTDHAANQRCLTPLHRAVQARNHQALSMLLDSEGCDPLARDKDFKKPRDYCQRLLFMQKMLRKAEVTKLVSGGKEGHAR